MRYVYIIAILSVLVAVKVAAYEILMGANLGGLPVVSACPMGQTCYYVAHAGNDANSGKDPGHPWATVAKVSTILSSLNPGDAVFFNGGDTWNEKLTLGDTSAHAVNGSSSKTVHIGSYGIGQPIFDELNAQPYCVGEINPATANAPANSVSYTTIDNFECRHSYAYGMVFIPNGSSSPGMTISNNYIHNTGFYCSVRNGSCGALNNGSDADPPDWSANTTYAANSSSVQTIIRPAAGTNNANNGGQWWYIQSASSCKSGNTAEPIFPQTAGQTLTEGSPACTWTNTGMHSTYKNQLMVYAVPSGADGFHLIGNTVKWGGGHNLFQVEADTGALLVQGNHVGPGGVHGGMDFKDVGTAAAPAMAINNTSTCGYSLGLCGCNNANSIGNNICTPDAGKCSGSSCSATPTIYTSVVGSNGWSPPEFVEYIGNTAYDSPVDFQMQPNGTNGCQGTACPLYARYYNNTAYTASHTGFYAFYQGNSGTNSTLDMRNNLFDGNRISTSGAFLANSPTGGFTTVQAYNNIGGSQGNVFCNFNGSACVVGSSSHGLHNVDPTYVNASAFDFDFLIGSPDIGVGLNDLPGNNPNIGAYIGTGQ